MDYLSSATATTILGCCVSDDTIVHLTEYRKCCIENL